MNQFQMLLSKMGEMEIGPSLHTKISDSDKALDYLNW